MVDPLSTVFIAALVTGAGTEVGKRLIGEIWGVFKAEGKEQVLEKLQHNPTTQDTLQAQQQLTTSLQRNPALAAQLRSALTYAERRIQANPKMGRQTWGRTKEEMIYKKTSRCPIGGEWLWMPHYFDMTGRDVYLLIKANGQVIGECEQGHRWFVFDL